MQTLDPVRPANKLANNNQKNIDHESPRYHIPHNQNTVGGGGKQNHYESATANQNDFLPREAWTDFSAAGDTQWRTQQRGRSTVTGGGVGALQSDTPAGRLYQFGAGRTLDRPGLLIAGMGSEWGDREEISPTMNSLESSDVTISTNSSSDTYNPKCVNTTPGLCNREST